MPLARHFLIEATALSRYKMKENQIVIDAPTTSCSASTIQSLLRVKRPLIWVTAKDWPTNINKKQKFARFCEGARNNKVAS